MLPNVKKRPREEENESAPVTVKSRQDIRTLREMFPNKPVVYLTEKLQSWEGSLESLIERLLVDRSINDHGQELMMNDETIVLSSDEEDNIKANTPLATLLEEKERYSRSLIIISSDDEGPIAGPSNVTKLSVAESNYKTLSELLPDVSPDFLREKASEIGGDKAHLERFLENSLGQSSNLPSRKEYENHRARTADEDRINKMTPEEFLREFNGNPLEHYMDITSKVSENYRKDTVAYIVKHFPQLSIKEINQLIEAQNGHFLPSVKQAEMHVKNNSKRKGKALSKRKINEVPKAEKDLQFIKEHVFFNLLPQIEQLKEKEASIRAEKVEQARQNGSLFDCEVCYDSDCLLEESVACLAGCLFCPDCVRRGVAVQIGEDKTVMSCLMGCGAVLPLSSLQSVISATQLVRLQQRQQAEEVRQAGLEDLMQCPACSYSAIISDPGLKVFYCANPECKRETCRLCGEKNHVPLSCAEVEKDTEVAARRKVEDAMTNAVLRECPKCKKMIMKTDGCNHMTCVCGQHFCYICNKPLDKFHRFGGFMGNQQVNGICPGTSNNHELHIIEAKTAGEKAKGDLTVDLKHDPLKVLPH